MDGQSKRQTKLHMLQICICQPLKIRLPTFPQMFIPCSKHGLLNKIITVPNLKSKLINMTELHRVNLLHPPKNSTILYARTLHRKKLSSEKQSHKWPRQATNISNPKLEFDQKLRSLTGILARCLTFDNSLCSIKHLVLGNRVTDYSLPTKVFPFLTRMQHRHNTLHQIHDTKLWPVSWVQNNPEFAHAAYA